MGSPLYIPVIFFLLPLVSSISYTEFIYPNFLATNINSADNGGAFLYSLNKTFKAAIFNPLVQESSFYFCVIHVTSNTIIWSANRNDPISSTGNVNLTIKGISITDEDGNLRWSTPQLQSVVYALRLTDIGNLVLLDRSNVSLWESFRYPTDTIVVGQSLSVGTVLLSSISSSNLSSSNYSFSVSSSDALLQWYGQIYWRLSMDPNAFINSNAVVEQMIINSTGLYLLARNSSVVVIQVILPRSNFRIAKLESTGQFIVKSFSSGGWTQEFIGPVDSCRIPFFCGQVGLCSEDGVTNSPSCSCSSSFHPVSSSLGSWGCKPIDHSIVLASPCNSSSSGNEMKTPVFSYLGLGYGLPRRFSLEALEASFNFCQVGALGTWVFSVAGALLAIPVGIKRKSLAPLVFFGTTGTMLDIIMGISACEREHAERQMKLLEEAQNSATEAFLNDSNSDS
ncbi:hypothetical protein Csa_012354 [Cucumis sativus]|nr:hypothetical protein Csa_012354 [Cucumis sativus]